MARRARWFISGTGFGVGLAVWMRKKIKDRVEDVTLLAIAKAAVESIARLTDRIGDAVIDARAEAAQTEASLRKQMGLDDGTKPQVKR